MSPIRHEDDFRRKEIDNWDDWIESEIRKAQERGEFSDLPTQGKPIEIYRTDVNPEYDLAFSRLKNAGVMPVWMELDGEVRRLSEALDAFLERSVVYLTQQRALLVRRLHADAQPVTAEPAPAWPWWQVWRPLLAWFRMPAEPVEEPEPGPRSTGELIQLREHIRAQYLERAAELDKKIAEYHNALPQNLTNLQRLRLLPDRAARRFDARLPIGFVLDAATDTGKDEDTPTP